MNIPLSDHFTYKKLLRFTLPSIAMMIFTSIYGVVDGYFVSNFVGKTPFAAINFIYPVIMILGACGFMLGAGGSALIAKTLGEGNQARAQRLFTMTTLVSVTLGVVLGVVGILLLRPIANLMGAEGELLEYCVLYGRILLLALPAFMLQMEFQSFFIAAEKPQLGFFVTVAAGCTNMVLDALFVGVLPWGLVGAAAATALSQTVGGIVPVLYFARKNTSLLHFTRPTFDGRALLRICTNGSSELLSNISMSLVGMLYNIQLMKYAGEDGVAAYGVLMYLCMVFISAFIGYSIGTAPVVSFHYGAQNRAELKSLLKKSLWLISVCSVVMLLLGEVLAKPLSLLFVGYDPTLLALTNRAFLIFSFSFLFSGIGIYGSGFFTALNNGLVSAIISFLRTVVFQTAAILLLPLVWGTDGIWVSVVLSDLAAAAVTALFLVTMRKKYGY